MASDHHSWDAKCIRERFTIVKTEITQINTGHKKELVLWTAFCLVLLLVTTYISFEDKTGTVFLGTVIGLVGAAFVFIFIIINASEKCISKLSFCLLAVDDKQRFFELLSQVSCGDAAIGHFLEFVDRATKVIEVVNPAASPQAAQQNPAQPIQGDNHAK
jgi:hypothetical protein